MDELPTRGARTFLQRFRAIAEVLSLTPFLGQLVRLYKIATKVQSGALDRLCGDQLTREQFRAIEEKAAGKFKSVQKYVPAV